MEVLIYSAPSSKKNNLSAADLEEMRSDHGGSLVFAVDVNEAANGSEKALVKVWRLNLRY